MSDGDEVEPQDAEPPPRRRRRRDEPPTQTVRVRFYRAVRGDPPREGWDWPDDGDVRQALADRYEGGRGADGWPIVTHWGREFFVEQHVTTSPMQFGVSTVRVDKLPLVLLEGAATGSPLSIGDRDRLLEPAYLTFFENRIVAVVRQDQSPNHRLAAGALSRLTGIDLELVPIPRPDIVQAVQQGTGVSRFDITIAGGSIDAAVEEDDLVLAAEQVRSTTPGAAKVTITVGAATPEDKTSLRRRVLRTLNRRGVRNLEGAHATVLTADGVVDYVNLLEADIATSARVPIHARTRHRLPDEAQEAAIQAFGEQRVAITRSIALAGDD